MKDETRELVREITARVHAAHADGRRDLQRVLDSATAAALALGADGGEEAAEMARLIRALMLGVSSVFQELKAMEERARALEGITLSSLPPDIADLLGRLWGNPELRRR